MNPPSKLIAHIVTYNSEATIVRCISSLLESEGLNLGQDFEIWVTDNASEDSTASLLKKHFADSCRLKLNDQNLGFCQANNEAASEAIDAGAAFFLLLNPDLRLRPQSLIRLKNTLASDSRAGSACPKLLRADGDLNAVQPHVLDASGMYITPCIRHFDRGSQQADQGQFDQAGYVFGGSGAALLMKTEFMIDVALNSASGESSLQVLDEAFFAYREDADLAWRAQWLGWKCRYVPSAVGFHQRVVLPEYRAFLPAHLNAMSVRNRFLLQFNNWSWLANSHCITQAAFRNLLVIAGAFLIERTSLGALKQAWAARKRALAHRKQLLRRKRTSAFSVGKWFAPDPRLEPAPTQSRTAPISSLQIVIINYNSGDRLLQCLTSITSGLDQLNKRLKNCSITVVDNASADRSAVKAMHVLKNNPQLQFQMMTENLGFAGAINHATGQMRADAILVLNPDIETNIKAITHLLDSLEQDSTIGAVAPLLRDHDGHMQTHYSCRRLPTLGSAIAELFFLHQLWPSNPWTRHYLMQDEPLFDQFIQQSLPPANAPYESRDNPCLVEQPAAACLMVRGIAFRRVGGFDQLFWPAWFEDVDFCKRLHQAGFTTALNGKAIVKHEGGYSKDIIEPAVYAKAWYTNQKRYWKKHYSTANYFIFRTLWGTALVVRGLISGLLSIGAIFQGLSKASSLYKLAIAQLSLAFCPTDKGGISRDATESKTNWGSRVKKSAIHLRKAWHILRDSEYRVLDREPLAPSVPFSKARKSNSPASQMAQPELNRVLASSLSGHGIVIGFLPENTRLKPNVRYDSIGKSEDFITDSAKQISDGYYDFVVGSSILQQSANPIKTLIEMHRITRSGGCIYITLDRTPERGYRTPIEHFLFEVEEHSPERQKDAQLQQLLRSSDISGIAAISHSQTATLGTKTKSTNLLSTEDLTQLIHWFNQRNTPLEIETGPLALQKSNALHYILRKG